MISISVDMLCRGGNKTQNEEFQKCQKGGKDGKFVWVVILPKDSTKYSLEVRMYE